MNPQSNDDPETKELLLFLENLDGIESWIKSDHVLNLFTEVDGKLPGDKERMTGPIRQFLNLDPEEQMLFAVGRRSHRFATIEDLNDPVRRGHAMDICNQFGATVNNMDQIIDTIMQRFI